MRGNDNTTDSARTDAFTKLVESVGRAMGVEIKCVRSIVWPDDDERDGFDDDEPLEIEPSVHYEARRKGVRRNVTWTFSGPAICDVDMVTDSLEPLLGNPAPSATIQ